jgi:chemotaxis protein methyltransferase CheR
MRSDILAFFANYIEKELGIIYSQDNYFQLQNRLEEICRLLGVADVENLYLKAQSGISGAFQQLLLDLATNNETSFFRDPKVFKTIEKFIVPDFIEKYGAKTKMQIWSAASSTGQEALSISMLLKEMEAKSQNKINFSILGSDISERVLKKAQEGNYSQLEVQRGLPAAMLLKYFKKLENDQWAIDPHLLAHVEYKKINLKSNFPFVNRFHLVLCRNVLIYQNVDSKIEILNRIATSLVPGGYLILGSGESLQGLSSEFELRQAEGAVFYRKKMGVHLEL